MDRFFDWVIAIIARSRGFWEFDLWIWATAHGLSVLVVGIRDGIDSIGLDE
jgi:hypothetical protein